MLLFLQISFVGPFRDPTRNMYYKIQDIKTPDSEEKPVDPQMCQNGEVPPLNIYSRKASTESGLHLNRRPYVAVLALALVSAAS